jgi:enoyl-CoA hydratase/carnithine racemase
VLSLTLARPDKRNALNLALTEQLVDAIRRGNGDAGVGAILIDAEGPAFSAGMDLDEALADDAPAMDRAHAALFQIGLEVRTPIIAIVQGRALGGALGLIANAHVAIAASTAEFGLTELRVGMWPFLIWPSVTRAIGERRTLELALTSRLFGASEALAWGLVHEVVEPSALAARGREVAQLVADASPETIARGLRLRADPSLGPALRLEQRASPDFHEGVDAFRHKRRPHWPSTEQ